jgi:uncharacterized membrane protein YphA (DoxX/SURF4 family)
MNQKRVDLALLIARVPLGIYFIIAGYNKVLGPGVGNFISSNLENAQRFMPEILAKFYLGALPWVEIIVGAFLAFGFYTRTSALLIALMLVSFTMAMGGLELNMARVSGGNGPPFNKNIIFLGLAIMLTLTGGGSFGVERFIFKRKATAV